MIEYALIKWIHILSATLLFGTGLGSAFYKWCADRQGNLATMAHTNRMVVIADWAFTTPTIIIQPITGLWLVHLLGIPLDQGWVLLTLFLYCLAGACWLPVVWLQIRMRDLAHAALTQNSAMDSRYQRYAHIWFWLGIPAFSAMIGVYFLMVFKPAISF
ncbi:DUF2269 family protein [Sedimenticola hydrogenitrophicus]|uniref:DUF2269 family protein n=1 Tax=Sedimenticola hydrogenitrophicus TaxID=2967975 RepID=UPI0027395A4A|nr:DUF2269 domain-containing protein [Sedimenticola hydrogenitrophicus]